MARRGAVPEVHLSRLLLLGSTGLVGGSVLKKALADSRVTAVVAVTRRPMTVRHPKLENPVVDFNSLDVTAPWWRADAVVCTLGTTMRQAGSQKAFRKVDLEYPLAVARLARNADTPAFVLLSSVGADSRSRTFYLRTKGEAEEALKAVGFPSFTTVRPSGLVGQRVEFRLGESVLFTMGRLFRPIIPPRYRLVRAEDVASRLLVAALEARPGVTVVESETIPSGR